MSHLRSKNRVLAILCSDIHLCHKAPVARSAEPDWYEAMARPLAQLSELQHKLDDVPIVIAGDLFDHWKAPPELINFALDYLPDNVWAIPGQHDLPYHSLDDIHKSAYWILQKVDKIHHIGWEPLLPTVVPTGPRPFELWLHGFPWGCDVSPLSEYHQKELSKKKVDERETHLAVIHAYVWHKEHKQPRANHRDQLIQWSQRLVGYQAAVFGDNHKGFTVGGKMGDITKRARVMNCGTLMRRKADEYHYRPRVGLLLKDSSIIEFYLDTSLDQWIDSSMLDSKSAMQMSELQGFLDELNDLGDATLNFTEALERLLASDSITTLAKKVILSSLENAR